MPLPKQSAPLQPITTVETFDRLAVDISELTTTSCGNKYVLVLTDYFSRWVEAFPMKDYTAATVARIIVEEVFCRYGLPAHLHSDNSQPFSSKLMEKVNQLLNVHHFFTSPYHPQGDGLVERFNKTLAAMLRDFVDHVSHDDWDTALPYVLFAYRTAVQESINDSPFFMMFGRNPRLPVDFAFGMHALSKSEEDVAIGDLLKTDGPTLEEARDYKQRLVRGLKLPWRMAQIALEKA